MESVKFKTRSLHTAVKDQNLRKVQNIIQEKVLTKKMYAIDVPDEEGNIPLHIACGKNGGNLDIVKTLLFSNQYTHEHFSAHTNYQNHASYTPFILACSFAHLAIINLLLPYANIHTKTREGLNALDCACSSNQNMFLIKLLIENGADFCASVAKVSQHAKGILLHNACGKDGGDFHIVRALVEAGANNSIYDNTLLAKACYNNYWDIVIFLIPHVDNVIINAGAPNYATPLSYAIAQQRFEVVDLLLRHGAQLALTQADKNTLLRRQCRYFRGDLSIIKTMLQQGADANDSATINGNTIFMDACDYGFMDVAKLLLPFVKDINAFNKQKLTALAIACKEGHSEMIALLVEHGAVPLMVPQPIVDNMHESLKKLLTPKNGYHTAANNGRQAPHTTANNSRQSPYATPQATMPSVGPSARQNSSPANLADSHLKAASSPAGTPLSPPKSGDKIYANTSSQNSAPPILPSAPTRPPNMTASPAQSDLASRLCSAVIEKDVSKIRTILSKEIVTFKALSFTVRNPQLQEALNRSLLTACSRQWGNLDIVKLLIENGADSNYRDASNGNTPFLAACGANYEHIASHLLPKVTSIHTADFEGNTAISGAASNGNVAFVKLLMAHGASIAKIPLLSKNLLLRMACSPFCKDIPFVKTLLSVGAQINAQNPDHTCTPLLNACLAGSFELVKLLVEAGADVNYQNIKGDSPLLIACTTNNEAIAHYLIPRLSSIDLSNNEGFTSLAYACAFNYTDLIKVLLANGAHPENIRQATYATLDDSLKSLLETYKIPRTPSANRSNGNSHTPQTPPDESRAQETQANTQTKAKSHVRTASDFRAAVESNNHPLVQSIIDNEITKENLFTIDDSDGKQSTALHKACGKAGGNLQLVDSLIKHGSQLNLRNKFGLTAFSLACYWGHWKIVEHMVSKIEDIDETDNDGVTALSHASLAKKFMVVELLLKNGAQPSKINREVMSILNPDIKNMLETRQQKINQQNAYISERKLGTWGKVYLLITDDARYAITENEVYESLGFTMGVSRSNSAFLSAQLLALAPDTTPSTQGVYKVLINAFHEDRYQDLIEKAKASFVNKMINVAFAGLKTNPNS